MKDRSWEYVNLLVNAAAIKPEAIVVAMVIGEILCLHFADHTTKTVQILAVLSNQANFLSHLTLNSSLLQHSKVPYLAGVLLSRSEAARTSDHKDDLVDSEEGVGVDADVTGQNVALNSRKWNVHQWT